MQNIGQRPLCASFHISFVTITREGCIIAPSGIYLYFDHDPSPVEFLIFLLFLLSQMLNIYLHLTSPKSYHPYRHSTHIFMRLKTLLFSFYKSILTWTSAFMLSPTNNETRTQKNYEHFLSNTVVPPGIEHTRLPFARTHVPIDSLVLMTHFFSFFFNTFG